MGIMRSDQQPCGGGMLRGMFNIVTFSVRIKIGLTIAQSIFLLNVCKFYHYKG